jgi:hypothetical protein
MRYCSWTANDDYNDDSNDDNNINSSWRHPSVRNSAKTKVHHSAVFKRVRSSSCSMRFILILFYNLRFCSKSMFFSRNVLIKIFVGFLFPCMLYDLLMSPLSRWPDTISWRSFKCVVRVSGSSDFCWRQITPSLVPTWYSRVPLGASFASILARCMWVHWRVSFHSWCLPSESWAQWEQWLVVNWTTRHRFLAGTLLWGSPDLQYKPYGELYFQSNAVEAWTWPPSSTAAYNT